MLPTCCGRAALLVAGTPLIAIACLAPPASAQSPSVPAPAKERQAASRETVIISNVPEGNEAIHGVLKKYFGEYRGEVAGVPGSEVWSVPSGQTSRVTKELQTFGLKVTKLGNDWNHILNRQPGSLTRDQLNMINAAKAAPGTVDVHVMRAADSALSAFAMTNEGDRTTGAPAKGKKANPPSRIVLPISASTNITLERIRYVTDERGCAWVGSVAETGESAVLIRWNDGQITGVVSYKGHIYRVSGLSGNLQAVIETDPRKLPPDHGPLKASTDPRADLRPDVPVKADQAGPAPAVIPLSDTERRALEAKPVTIDVMMLYTKRAESRSLRIDRALAVSIEQVNETFRNSGLGNVSIRLVHTQAVDYDESDGEHFDHLYRMVDGVGQFKDVRKLRDERKADIVGLVVDDASGCGLSTRVAPDADDAYFVVHHSCAVIAISVAHEIGHILGARHDRAFDPRNVPFAYGHGYLNGKKWRDIMSYQQSCDGCLRIPYWSNPRIMYKGEPTGTLLEDNARVILEQAEKISKFR